LGKPKKVLKVIPLGGLGEIGLNMMLFEYKDDIIVVDCGLMFPEDYMLGIDIVIQDISYLRERAQKIRGIVITHGHEDHTGALPFFLQEINVPIYGTKLTLGLIKEKLKEFKLTNKVKLKTIKPGDKTVLGAFEVEYMRVTHSIADGVGLAINTPVGTIIHSGDFKLDQTPVDGKTTDLHKFAEYGAKGVLALFSDSTNVESEGFTLSESEISSALDEIFNKAKGRIIIATFSSNIHRVQQVIDAAHKYKRKLILSGKSMVANFKIAHNLGYLRVPKELIVELSELPKMSKHKVVILTTGSQGEPMSVLTRIALADHNKIKIEKNDIVVLSSKFIPGNEKSIANIINNLYKRGAEVIYEKVSEVHVSGHASQEELKLMINTTKPKFFVPIHGEFRHLVQHINLAKKVGIRHGNTILAQNGDVIRFTKTSGKVVGSIEGGRVFVDGKGIGDVSNLVIRDRKHLSQDGMVTALMLISKTNGEILYGPEVFSSGVMLEDENKDIIRQAKYAIIETFDEINLEAKRDFAEVKTEVRRCLRRLFNKKLQRRPVIFPIIVEI
jgi:ribonuclease J